MIEQEKPINYFACYFDVDGERDREREREYYLNWVWARLRTLDIFITLKSSLTVPVSTMSVCASKIRVRPLLRPALLVGSLLLKNHCELVKLSKLPAWSSACFRLTISKYLYGIFKDLEFLHSTDKNVDLIKF